MSERDNDQGNAAIDPPENTGPEVSMDSPEEAPQAIDPPENTKTKEPLE